ncbi:MAG: transketolase family protein [Patescibacteria group bacterium]
MRQTVAKRLFELAQKDSDIVAMTADLSSSVGFDTFKENLPEQYIQCGIAEQEMLSMAAGLALSGQKPFAGSFAAFHPGRNWDQLRASVCYNQAPVRLISSHYGLSVGGDGATHQCLEYLALTLPLPHLNVLMPFNNSSAEWCIDKAYAQNSAPTVLFQPRDSHPEIMEEINTSALEQDGFSYVSKSEKAKNLIISCGLVSYSAYQAMDIINQTDSHTDLVLIANLTGFNQERLVEIIQPYSNIIIVEEHQQHGGLGSLMLNFLSEHKLSKNVLQINTGRQFGKSGLSTSELWSKFGFGAISISDKIKNL